VKIVLTGSTGFIGSRLCQTLLHHGYEVRATTRDLARTPFTAPKLEWIQYAMPEAPPAGMLGAGDTLIHCGFQTEGASPRELYRINLLGTERLLEAAKAAGVARVVFISSFAAHEQAESAYGTSKLRIERMLDLSRDLILRPGLVVGDGGLYRRLSDLLAKSPVVPLFYGGRQTVQTIGVDELCEAVVSALKKDLTGRLLVAEPEATPIGVLYRQIAASRGARPWLIPFPGTIALGLLLFLERLGLRLPITSENLLGLRQMRSYDLGLDLKKLGISISPFRETLKRLGQTETHKVRL
jgi:nucleoside-diphosphate-sugar epimerase